MQSHCFTNALAFTPNSMLALIWILSCTKPRTDHGSWSPGMPASKLQKGITRICLQAPQKARLTRDGKWFLHVATPFCSTHCPRLFCRGQKQRQAFHIMRKIFTGKEYSNFLRCPVSQKNLFSAQSLAQLAHRFVATELFCGVLVSVTPSSAETVKKWRPVTE